MKILGMEFDKKFGIGYLISSIIVSIGGFLIYAIQSTKFSFNLNEFLLQIPIIFFGVFILSLIFGILINYGVEE